MGYVRKYANGYFRVKCSECYPTWYGQFHEDKDDALTELTGHNRRHQLSNAVILRSLGWKNGNASRKGWH